VADAGEVSGGGVEAIEAAADSADPDEAAAVLSDGSNLIVAQAGGVGRVVAISDEAIGCAVEKIKAIVGANPEVAGAVLIEGEDAGAGEGIGVGRTVEIADETVGRVSIAVKAVFGANPEVTGAVGQEDVNPGIAKGGRVAFDGKIDGEVIAVKFVQAGFRAKPEEAKAVAGNGENRVLGKPLLDGEGAEEKMRTELGGEAGWREGDEGKDKSNGENSQEKMATKTMGIIGIVTGTAAPPGVQ